MLRRQLGLERRLVDLGGSTASGAMSIWRSNSSRRGEAEARTRIGIARG
jgi:hypothetical protein